MMLGLDRSHLHHSRLGPSILADAHQEGQLHVLEAGKSIKSLQLSGGVQPSGPAITPPSTSRAVPLQ